MDAIFLFSMSLERMLTAYRVFVAIFQVVIILLILTAVYPLATQQIKVEEIGEPDIAFDGTNIILKVPVKIANKGIYDISDISLEYVLSNHTSKFIENREYLGTIKSGEEDVIPLPVIINLTELYRMEQPNFYHFFHGDIFQANFTLSLKYLFGMIFLESEYYTNISWKPPIKEYSIGNGYSFSLRNSTAFIYIPFTLDTQKYLWGEALVSGNIITKDGKIGNINGSASLGEYYQGELCLELKNWKELMIKSQDLKFLGNLTVFQFPIPFSYIYHWGAPFANLTYSLEGDKVVYSFRDESSLPLDLYINATFYSGNTLVKEESERMHVNVGEETTGEILLPSESFDTIVITFEDVNSGAYYREVVNL